jgi:uncharacterized protein YndB with AHSA1/START domain
VSHHEFDVERRTTAPPEAVWRWLADAASWKDWTALTDTYLEREGRPVSDGVGAIRHFGRAGGSSREEVVVFDPPRHLAYVLLRGLPIANYRADVYLEPVGTGTRIHWHGTFDTAYPGTGTAMKGFLRLFLRDTARRLAARAERGTGPAPGSGDPGER